MAKNGNAKKMGNARRKGARYGKRRGAKGKATFAKKVMNVVNNRADKKQTPSITYLDQRIGQFTATSATTYTDTAFKYAAFPLVATGNSDTTRVGNRIHWTGCQIRLQVRQTDPSLAIDKQKYRLIVFAQKGVTPSAFDITQLLKPSPMFGTTDYLSVYNNDYRSQFKIICDRKFAMPQKQYAGQVVVQDNIINLKLNIDQHFYSTTSTSPVDMALYWLLLADTGNASTGFTYTAATPDFAVKTLNSGLTAQLYVNSYFTDV